MAKKRRVKQKSNPWGWRGAWIGIILVLLLGVGFLSQGQSFAIYDKPAWIPMFASAECVSRADSMAVLDLGTVDNKGEFFACNSEEAGKYVPLVNGVQCDFLTDASFSLNAYDCPAGVKDSGDVKADCKKLSGFLSDSKELYSIDAGRQIYIDPINILGIGSLSLKARFPSYGLKIETADGRIMQTTTTCEIKSFDNDVYHTLEAGDQTIIVPDSPLNVVTGLQKAYSSQLVTLSGVNNGEPIYITRPGYYYKLAEADDGFIFVDTASGEKQSDEIKCIPRTTGCSDEAQIVDLEEQSCDLFGGSISGYAPVKGDLSKLCTYECLNGELAASDDCIKVQTDCPDDKPLWDASTGECVAVEPLKDDEEAGVDYLFIAIIGIVFVLIILIMVLIKMNKRQ